MIPTLSIFKVPVKQYQSVRIIVWQYPVGYEKPFSILRIYFFTLFFKGLPTYVYVLLCLCACVCIPILVTTFPEWLRGTEPLPHTPAPCVRPRCVCSAGLIRQAPPPTFCDTAITDNHSDTTIFQLRAHWVRLS